MLLTTGSERESLPTPQCVHHSPIPSIAVHCIVEVLVEKSRSWQPLKIPALILLTFVGRRQWKRCSSNGDCVLYASATAGRRGSQHWSDERPRQQQVGQTKSCMLRRRTCCGCGIDNRPLLARRSEIPSQTSALEVPGARGERMNVSGRNKLGLALLEREREIR